MDQRDRRDYVIKLSGQFFVRADFWCTSTLDLRGLTKCAYNVIFTSYTNPFKVLAQIHLPPNAVPITETPCAGMCVLAVAVIRTDGCLHTFPAASFPGTAYRSYRIFPVLPGLVVRRQDECPCNTRDGPVSSNSERFFSTTPKTGTVFRNSSAKHLIRH